MPVKTKLHPFLTGHSSPKGLLDAFTAADKPPEALAHMFLQVCYTQLEDPGQLEPVLVDLFRRAQQNRPVAEAEKLKAEYQQKLQELAQGPCREATFVREADPCLPGPKPKVEVLTPDGQRRYPTLGPDVQLPQLRGGATVFLDPEGALVLAASTRVPRGGQEAKFLRLLPDGQSVELQLRDDRFVFAAAQPLLDEIAAGRVKRNDSIVFCPRREFAFAAVPTDEDRSHRFVDRSSIPDVIASRDIGRPHWSLAWLLRRTRILLERPDIRHRFDLRWRASLMMVGPSGTGKTLTIRAFLRSYYEMLTRRTGRTDLGSRVIRVKPGDLLSQWFGVTDQNLERLFDDVREIGCREEVTADGQRLRLPVVLIIEECEALARRRGDGEATAIYDRVIGTLLQRLDDPTDDLAGIPLIILATSNRPDMLDVAAWRRLGGMVARFHRLDREGLYAVLSKKIKVTYPLASHNGDTSERLRERLLDDVVAAFHSPNLDDALVEVTLRDGAKLTKSPRHFFTGALIEQAVSQAIDQAAFAALDGDDEGLGLSSGLLVDALWQQVQNLAENLTVHNVSEYVDLPDNARVAEVRRLRPRHGHVASLMR
jgi:hypothetical protein